MLVSQGVLYLYSREYCTRSEIGTLYIVPVYQGPAGWLFWASYITTVAVFVTVLRVVLMDQSQKTSAVCVEKQQNSQRAQYFLRSSFDSLNCSQKNTIRDEGSTAP